MTPDAAISVTGSRQSRQMNLADVADSIASWFYYFLKKWWLFLITAIVFGTLGVLNAYYGKTEYESNLTFALEDNGGGGLSGALSLAADLGLNVGGENNIFSGENITKIMTGRRIIEDVLLSADTVNGKIVTFANEYMQINAPAKPVEEKSRLSGVSFPVQVPREKFSYLQDSVLSLISGNIAKNDLIVKKQDKKLDVYEVKFKSLQERFTKVFTERLVQQTTAFYTDLRSKRSKNTLQVLEQRAATLKSSATSSINQRLATQDANVNPAYAAAQAPILNKEMDIKVYGGAYAELFKNLEVARVQYLKDVPLLQIIDPPNYPMKKIKKGRLMTGVLFALGGTAFLFVFLFFRRIILQQRQQKNDNSINATVRAAQ